MLLNLAEIVKRTQALLDDPSGSTMDQAYLLPFINQGWDDLANKLTSLGLSFEEVVTVLTPVAANSTNLDLFMGTGNPLESMMLPTFMEWRLTTELDVSYREVPIMQRVPDVPSGYEWIRGWEWRGGHIYIAPSSVDTTVRLRYKAVSANFVDPNDQRIVGTTNILAYKAAEIVCSPAVRNNAPGAQWLAAKGQEAMDDFEIMCVKQQQRNVYRFGRVSGRNRRQSVILK